MKCPHCENENSQVVETQRKTINEIPTTRRRRRCLDCRKTFVTYEVAADQLEFEDLD